MIDVTITRDGEITNRAHKKTQAQAESWVANCEKDCAFGRPAGWYRLQNGVDTTQASFLTYDARWTIPLSKVLRFEAQYDEAAQLMQTWAKCKADYVIRYTNVSADAELVREKKRQLRDRVESKIEHKIYKEFSLLEILAIITAPTPDPVAVASIQNIITTSLAEIATLKAAINACTTLEELDALNIIPVR